MGDEQEIMVRLHQIHKTFGSNEVLNGIDLEVKKGEVLAIIGPSGSGKSTTLRCMNRLEEVDSGSIEIEGEFLAEENGEGVTEYADSKTSRRLLAHMGMVFQQFNLFPHMTVMQNLLEAPIHVKKQSADEVLPLAEELLRKVGLYDKRDSYPSRLSGGQQQRVAIARALAMHPQMLFFDEPTSALDPELTTEVLKILRQLAEKKMTMVIVTHEIDFARAVSDRVIFMADGYIVEEGAPADVIDNPRNPRTQAFLRKVQR